MINWIKTKLFNKGQIMATANYTEAQTEKMVAQYNANPNRETVEALAKEGRTKIFKSCLERRRLAIAPDGPCLMWGEQRTVIGN